MTDNQTKYPFLHSVLARRFIFYILLLSSLLTLFGASLQLYLDYSKDKAQIQRHLDQIKTSHLPSVVNTVWVSDQEQINILLHNILTLPDIEYIEFRSIDKNKVHFGTRQTANFLSREYPLTHSFRNNEIELGSLYIEATLEKARQRIFSRASLILLIKGLEIFFVALFVLFLFYLLVGRHLLTMADYARGIDLKTLGNPLSLLRPERVENDELDQVAAAVNQMRIGLLEDMKRKEKAEKETARRKAEFEGIFNSITDAVVFVDTDRRIIRINEAFAGQFGYAFEEVRGKTTEFFYADPEAYRNQGKARYHKGAVNKQPVYENEYIRRDGSVFPAETMGVPVKDQAGETIGFVGIMRDISDRKQAEKEKEQLEEQLRQSQKMEAVGTMAGGIAHDFNNILAIILGNMEMAMDGIPSENPIRHNLREVFEAAKRARDLVSQILAFSRKEKSELIPIRPQSMLKEALKLLRAVIPSTISIIQEISPDCSTIMANPIQFHQLTMNLFTNAVHAMDENGPVTVRLHNVMISEGDTDEYPIGTGGKILTAGEYVKLSVTDEGTGMSPERIERIFDPFYTTKEVGKGTGMGLSVVHGIVAGHGGFIKVESEVGKGSTFSIFFPVTEAEEQLEYTKKAALATGTERILVVDDEEGLVEMAKRMLESLGYTVRAESSSLEALELFKAAPDQFDLVITDQSMPNMSGADLTAAIVKIRPDIPVIICTGYSTKVSFADKGKNGISMVISKPYSKKILSESVRAVLDK